ncbi:MAG TPA: NAD-dependent epimerase/dehydratase family protein [Ignavibacteria bacterium]|nr:NAD-dependent epimerase/dehydratase family protein [Ignavibacteria bacterium]
MKVIITGATGMVGKGVLIECLENNEVDSVMIINRSAAGVTHPKLNELILKDFSDFNSIKENLKGYDACFHNMGISSLGMNEEEYYRITYSMTEALAKLLYENNPELVFNYVSGAGTDSTEKGKIMWARVKGKTENMVLNMGFKDAYIFRPGVIIPEKGVKSKTGWVNFMYALTKPLFPLMINSKYVTSSSRMGRAMINSVLHPQELKVLENKDINILAGE